MLGIRSISPWLLKPSPTRIPSPDITGRHTLELLFHPFWLSANLLMNRTLCSEFWLPPGVYLSRYECAWDRCVGSIHLPSHIPKKYFPSHSLIHFLTSHIDFMFRILMLKHFLKIPYLTGLESIPRSLTTLTSLSCISILLTVACVVRWHLLYMSLITEREVKANKFGSLDVVTSVNNIVDSHKWFRDW